MKVLAIVVGCLAVCAANAATVNVTVGPGLSYTPNPVSVNVGDTVQWNWVEALHSSTSNPGSLEAWDSTAKSTGTFSHTFTHAGNWGYFCTVHGIVMSGTVQVSAPETTAVPTLSPRALLLLLVALALVGAAAITR
jgi:plastocyanin